MKRYFLAVAFIVVGFGAFAPAKAAAPVLYAADGAKGNATTHLFILNPTNGSVVQDVGAIGFAVTGLAFDPATGVLYGSTGGESPASPKSIITINRSTGAGTLLGSLGSGKGPAADITNDITTGKLFGWLESGDDLYTINKTTGAPTKVGESSTSTSGTGLAANRAGILFLAGQGSSGALRIVNKTTGTTTSVATLSGAPISGGTPALAFDKNGVLFGANNNEGGASHLITINTTTGAITDVGSTVNNLDALEFVFGFSPTVTIIIPSIIVRDLEAILSTRFSALPMALAQRELALSGIETALRDVNGRLFRIRTETESESETSIALAISHGKEIVSLDNKGKQITDKEAPAESRRFEVFASGDYGYADRDAVDRTSGFRHDVYAGSLGVETRVTKHLTLGLAGTLLESTAHLGSGIGKVDVSGFSISPYASFFWKNIYLDALYSYGRFEHDMHRDTIFGNGAHAESDSHNHTIQINTGYNMHFKGMVTGPFATLDYTLGHLDGYTESNAGRFNVEVPRQSYDSLKTRLGWQVSRKISTSFGAITPQLRASWVHEIQNNNEIVDANLVQSPFLLLDASGARRIGKFSASSNTAVPDRDALSLGGGVMTEIGDRWSVLVDYEVYAWQNNNLQQFASVRGSFRF